MKMLLRDGDFNCTIQELKHQGDEFVRRIIRKFQLHHTGIKTVVGNVYEKKEEEFQLHHTGIKTSTVEVVLNAKGSFQLHHTGIKTIELKSMSKEVNYFNCTIQELKLEACGSATVEACGFQLHHTGIKTYCC